MSVRCRNILPVTFASVHRGHTGAAVASVDFVFIFVCRQSLCLTSRRSQPRLTLSVSPLRSLVVRMSWVRGGSAIFVRPKLYARFGVTNKTMKKHIALGLVASTLFLAGCCTSHHVTQWEYKTLDGAISDASLNEVGAQGWSVVGFQKSTQNTGATYLLKRPKQ